MSTTSYILVEKQEKKNTSVYRLIKLPDLELLVSFDFDPSCLVLCSCICSLSHSPPHPHPPPLLFPYLLQVEQALPNCKPISVGRLGDVRYTTPSPHPTTPCSIIKHQLILHHTQYVMFVCVEVLRPSQPYGVMLSAVSLPNHTFIGQA